MRFPTRFGSLFIILLLVFGLSTVSIHAQDTETPTPTETSTDIPPTDTPIPTDTPVPTETPTDTPIPTSTPSDTPVPTATPTITPVPTDTPTITPSLTFTPTDTATWTPTSTPSPTRTLTPTGTPPYGTGTGLLGEYFDNQDFTDSKLVRIDPTINFDWVNGSPDSVIGNDTFTVRWSGQVQPRYTESYTFSVTSDDGVRLWVNGESIIDQWVVQGATTSSGTITLLAGQYYDIVLEYFEQGGLASVQLNWSSLSQVPQVIPSSQLYPSASIATSTPTPTRTLTPTGTPPFGTGIGLLAEYFDNQDFTDSKLVRIDPTVNFDWANGSPDAVIGVDTFTVRWSGQIQPRYTESYTFSVTSDDGVRLWVNGEQIINQWVVQGATTSSGTITLFAGQYYDIVLEYFEQGGLASVQLNWSSLSQVAQVIPASQLYPAASIATSTPTITPYPTNTLVSSPTLTKTPTPTVTRTPSPTKTLTPTRTPTMTYTPSRTPTKTFTPSITPTKTSTPRPPPTQVPGGN